MEEPGDGEVEVLEENGKQYPPRWIPVNKGTSEEEKTEINLYYFKKDLAILLINIILFVSNLDHFKEELMNHFRISIISLLSISFLMQIFLGIITVLNSPFFTVKKFHNANLMNDMILCSIFLLLIINSSVWICDVINN